MDYKYHSKLIPYAKKLRKEMTSQEKHLWYDFLAIYPVKFQRQKSLKNYIADFYCFKVKLIIEIDGSQHGEEKAVIYDNRRTEELNMLGFTVLRFTNQEIDREFEAVCITIDKYVKSKLDL